MRKLQRSLIQSLTTAFFLLVGATATAKDIVHDAEFYISQEQNGETWAKEDKALDKTLAEFRKKMVASRRIFSTS